MGRIENCEGRNRKSNGSWAERVSRAEFERRLGHPLSDSEWAKQRGRLVEFIKTLVRWDSEKRYRYRVDSGSVKPVA
jgi:hypothetical protein